MTKRRFALLGLAFLPLAIVRCVSDTPVTPDAGIDGALADSPAGDTSTDAACPTCPVVLATDQECPTSVAVDGPYVYWINRGKGTPPLAQSGSVNRAPKDPTGMLQPPTVLVPMQQDPGGLAVEPGAFYWTTTGTMGGVWTCPTNGCVNGTPRNIAMVGSGFPVSPVLDPADIYYSIGSGTYNVQRAPKNDAGGPFAVTPSSAGPGRPTTIALGNDGYVYYTKSQVDVGDGGAVLRIAKGADAGVKKLAPVDFAYGVAVDDSSLFYASLMPDGGVYRIARDGTGSVEVIAPGQSNPRGPAVDGTHVYWFGNGGQILFRRAKAGGMVETLATGQTNIGGVFLDATTIYWANCGAGPDNVNGSVMKLKK